MADSAPLIHPTALIDPKAEVDEGVHIGAYSVIEAGVRIGKGTRVDSHVVISGPTTIGENNHIYPQASVGQAPQDLKYHGEPSELIIGNGNMIREFATLHRGTEGGGMKTVIGDNNLFMAYIHIAHDCIIHNHVIISNNASLAGHVTVEDHVVLGGFSGVHQFCRIGKYAFIGAYAAIRKDIAPFMSYAFDPVKSYGTNSVGLSRAGYSTEQIKTLKQAWKDLVSSTSGYKENKEKYTAIAKDNPDIAYLMNFIESSERGVAK